MAKSPTELEIDPETLEDNRLQPWPIVIRLAGSRHPLERKEALGQARVHLIRYLKEHGVSAEGGQIKLAIEDAARRGIINSDNVQALESAIENRNRLVYHQDSVSQGEVVVSVKAIHDQCAELDSDTRKPLSSEADEAAGAASKVVGTIVGAVVGLAVLRGMINALDKPPHRKRESKRRALIRDASKREPDPHCLAATTGPFTDGTDDLAVPQRAGARQSDGFQRSEAQDAWGAAFGMFLVLAIVAFVIAQCGSLS